MWFGCLLSLVSLVSMVSMVSMVRSPLLLLASRGSTACGQFIYYGDYGKVASAARSLARPGEGRVLQTGGERSSPPTALTPGVPESLH